MPAIPLPRRGLRSLVVLTAMILGPYMVIRHLAHIDDDPTSLALDYLDKPDIPLKRDWMDWSRKSSGKRKDPPLGGNQIYQQAPGGRKKAVPAGKKIPPTKSKSRKITPDHSYLSNGLLKVNPNGQHPIYDLIEKAKEKWDSKLAKSSATLGQAVNEYRRRYGRPPPKGFEKWWYYAQENNVQLPDEYDQIHLDLDPFWALTPKQVRELVKKSSTKSGMYTISCPGSHNIDKTCTYDLVETGLNAEGLKVAKQRVAAQLGLLQSIEDDLEPVDAVFYSHDVPWQFVGHEYKSALEDAASVGEYYDTDSHDLDWAHLGWASACAPHKPLRKSYNIKKYPDLPGMWSSEEKTFIWDHKASMDPCVHPELTHLMGFLSSHGKGPGPSKDLFPVMAMCKTTLHSDVLAVSMEAWTEDVGPDPPWEEKTENKMLWRGKNTGIYFKDSVPWEISQRVNLVNQTASTSGTLPVLPLSSLNTPIGSPQETELVELNDQLVDVGFVDEPIQCDPKICALVKEKYTFKGRKNWKEGNQYKYLLDLDGNGWSARFKRLMTTNSAVLKSTIFPEWYTDRVQPWVHYIPIKPDLTDLYDVLTFFIGGHDDLAEEIATAGKKWSKNFWRKEDMISYQFRLFLELSRLMASNRDKASFTAKGSELD